MNKNLQKMKSAYTLFLIVFSFVGAQAQSILNNEELKTQKEEAIKLEQYRLAKIIQDEIDLRAKASETANINQKEEKSEVLLSLEKQQREAVTNENWALAKSIKNQRTAALGITVPPATATTTITSPGNIRERVWSEMKQTDFATSNYSAAASINANTGSTIIEPAVTSKLKNTVENEEAKDLKYRRSSLYTLMINDLNRQYADVIYNAFGNAEIPSKFNDHNVGPYLIEGTGGLKDQTGIISGYLNTNQVAKSLIAKWFNRNSEGAFNMKLIAERGMYDASALDIHIAKQTERGMATLADAGEELIGKTFVIVNDYKYTNKEEVVAKAKKASGWAKMAAAYVPGGSTITNTLDVAETAATVAGKGYVVKTTSYLYRLVWDEEAAAIFYNNYWTDATTLDPAKVQAFNNDQNFKLQLVGFQSAWADVQSTIFTNKSEADLIKMATIKATDKAIAKLARQYEEFRTKTPLYSTYPLSAKIGSKEGIESGDKFEVLEQKLTEEGKTVYSRVGIISVDKVWDNSLSAEEIEELTKQGKMTGEQFTTFKGSANKYYPGQLIKQIK